MNKQILSRPVIWLVLALLLSTGCSANTASEPTAAATAPAAAEVRPTNTAVPPTPQPAAATVASTATALPPTATAPPPPTNTAMPTNTATPDPTLITAIDGLVGTWYAAGNYIRFYADGTAHWAYDAALLDEEPYAVNSVTFVDGQMQLRKVWVSDAVRGCGNEVGRYEARLQPDGRLVLTVIDDTCQPRANNTAMTLEPVP